MFVAGRGQDGKAAVAGEVDEERDVAEEVAFLRGLREQQPGQDAVGEEDVSVERFVRLQLVAAHERWRPQVGGGRREELAVVRNVQNG